MPKMTIHTTVDIAAPASQAWRLFGEGFGEWAQWAPGIDSSTLEGPLAEGVVRVNQTAALGTVRQQLVRFAPGERALAYEMRSGLPPVFSSARNDWAVEELGPESCRLTGAALFVLKEEAAPMRQKLEGKMGMSLQVFAESLRDTLEDRPLA